jgi:hypothetical protein
MDTFKNKPESITEKISDTCRKADREIERRIRFFIKQLENSSDNRSSENSGNIQQRRN